MGGEIGARWQPKLYPSYALDDDHIANMLNLDFGQLEEIGLTISSTVFKGLGKPGREQSQ